jgi:hypothetical protein
MPKRKVPAKSPARGQQRQLSEWKLLGRYLRQMTGHDLDNYARLVGVLKERFARVDAPRCGTGYVLRKAASGWK